jgi:DNA-binding response OmpR family regulator
VVKRKRILVVEDDLACADMYRRALRFAGFNVDIATDGVSALYQLDAHPPDLVVLDLHLPRLRGEAILQEISSRSDIRDIPVIVVTGSDIQPSIAEAKAILRKPCDPQYLLSLVEQHVAFSAA